jgi:hypothetical protein
MKGLIHMNIHDRKSHLAIGILVSAAWLFGAGCGSGLDSDSDGGLPAWTGMRSFGVASVESNVRSLAVDSGSNVYVGGGTHGALDGQAFTGDADSVVIKYDASGAKQWTRLLGGTLTSSTGIQGVAIDSSGNVAFAGNTSGSLGGNTLTGSSDLMVGEYDSSGSLRWVKQLGVVNTDTSASGVAVGPGDSVYATGNTHGDLDGHSINGASYASFVAKYDSSGAKLWSADLGVSGGGAEGNAIAVDSSGNAYVAGSSDMSIGGATRTGSRDAMLVKSDSSGNLGWTKLLGVVSKTTTALSIALSPSGQICMGGVTQGQLDGQNGFGSTSNHYDIFITCYDSSGQKQNTTLYGKAGSDTQLNGLAIDSSGNFYVSGYATGQLGSDAQVGADDFMIARFDSSRQLKWVHQFGVSGKEITSNALAIDSSSAAASNRVFAAGVTYASVGGLTLTGTADGLIALYSADGTRQ